MQPRIGYIKIGERFLGKDSNAGNYHGSCCGIMIFLIFMQILYVSQETYKKKLAVFMEETGIFEDGKASKRI